MADRVLVMHEGRLVAEIPREQATEETVMTAATGRTTATERSEGAGRHSSLLMGPTEEVS
jgi:ABC-type glutathione transport system ATPase component